MARLSTDARSLLKRFGRGFAEEPAPLCSEWVKTNFRLSPETGSSEPFYPYPNQVAWLNCTTMPGPEVVTLRKGARVGYSTCLTASIAYKTSEQNRSVAIWLPNDEDADGFSDRNIDAALRDSKRFREALAGRTTHRGNRKGYKKFKGGNQLYIRGGKAKGNYSAISVHDAMYDELDLFDQDVGGSGSPLVLGDTRTEANLRAKSIRGSTPRDDGGLMADSERSADVVLGYFMQCPHCGHEHVLDYFGDVTVRLVRSGWVHEKGLTWQRGKPDTVCHICPKCGKPAHQADLGRMLEDGEWRTEDGGFRLNRDGLLDEGEPWPRHVAFYCWQAYSLNLSWAKIAVKREECEVSPTAQKPFVNETLGKYWEEGIINLTVDGLMNRAEEFEGIPDGVRLVTFGADVQADRVEVELVGWGAGEECWALHYEVLYGDTATDAFWQSDELRYLLFGATMDGDPRFDVEGHPHLARTPFAVSIGCIDSGGHWTDRVYDFCRQYQSFVFPAKGASQGWGKEVAPARGPALNRENLTQLVNVGTISAKDWIYQSAMIPRAGMPGYTHFRKGHGYAEDWYAQFLAERRVPNKTNPNRWTYELKPNHRRNEALDCRVYALAAARMIWRHNVDLTWREEAA